MYSAKRNSGEILSTLLMVSALVITFGSLLGAGSRILKSDAYAPVPRIERTEEKTTLKVIVDPTFTQLTITGGLCFGAGLGSGIEKTTFWASNDPPGKNVISNVLAQTFNGGSGDYPAPCIRPDFEGDAILTNKNATSARNFALTAKMSQPLTDACVDVYLHLYSNRQGRWPNFRRFKVNKNGICLPSTPTAQATTIPTVTGGPTTQPTVTGAPTVGPTTRPTIRPTGGLTVVPTRRVTTEPTSRPENPGACGKRCTQPGNTCEAGLQCVTFMCPPGNPGCTPDTQCMSFSFPFDPRCTQPIKPTVQPTNSPCNNPPFPTCSKPSITPSPKPTDAACVQNAPGWLDNDRTRFINSTWAKKHAYADCPSDNNGGWPTSALDCLIDDQASGPSAADKRIVNDPASLYYKHLTPTDLFTIIPLGSVRSLTQTVDDEVKRVIREAIVNAVKKNPERFSDISFDSVNAGMEGGRDGVTMRSISLWVHPVVETIITDAIGIRERARLFVEPYIEGAIGTDISTDDAEMLYEAALNNCGASAQGGVQSGLGVRKVFGEYTAVIQNWTDGATADDIFSEYRDCNIHIVRTMMCEPTTTPVKPTGSEKPHISGKITVRSCKEPESMRVSRCEKGGTRADCKDLVQEDLSKTTPADNRIWVNEDESDPENDLYVFNYRLVTDSQNAAIEEGEEYQLPNSSMKNDLTAYYSEHHADTVIATGERDFTINVPASECGPVPTVEPTDAPSCIFNPVAYVKIRENGQDTLFPEVGNDAEEWSTTNDKRLKKYGDEVFYRAPFDEDGQLQPCGPDGCDLTGEKYCCVDDNNTPADSYNLRKKPYDIASVFLYYPKDKFRIVAKCDHTGKCTEIGEDDSQAAARRVDKLPVGCGQEYSYGWVVERKPQAMCTLTDRCAPSIEDIKRDDISASSVKLRWNQPEDVDCKFNSYDLDIVEPTDGGIVVCSLHDIDPSETEGRCNLRYNRPTDESRKNALTKNTWLRDVPYAVNLYARDDEVPDCRSEAGQIEFTRDSGSNDAEFNTFALNLYDVDEFEEGGDSNLCWSVANNDGKRNIRSELPGSFSCAGDVDRDSKGNVQRVSVCYHNKKGDPAKIRWQMSRCEATDDNCQQDPFGANGDRTGDDGLETVADGNASVVTWEVSKFKPNDPIVSWETDLDECPRDFEGIDPSNGISRQVIPPFPPSKTIAPQGVAPVGFAAAFPDYQKTDDGKLLLNGIYLNDITIDPLSTDSEGNMVIAQEEDYRISFMPKYDNQLLIDILAAPFEEVRVRAESHLLQLLGSEEADACWLNTVESTTDTANPAEAGKNYMLSFCEYRLGADINDDGVINGIDFGIYAFAVNTEGYTGPADINSDGVVDARDGSIIADNFGRKTR
ncbi:MAG: hypothetical protein WBO77_00255 [Microgenomates group bacterium]